MRAVRYSVAPAAVLFLVGSFAEHPVRAQAPSSVAGGQPPAAATPPSAESLGVSLKNIRKQLNVPAKPAGSGDLRYNFQIEVFGKEPRIEFFREFNLSMAGGVRYGAPTHQEILNTVTPMGFRNYGGMDLLSLGKKK